MTDGLLINTLDCPGEFDAMLKLRPGETYFLLLGRDRLAPPLVQKWAWDNRERALKEFSEGAINEEKRNRELDKSTQAEAIGWAMQSYKAGDMAKKIASQPTEKTYSGAEVPEETKRRDALQSARIRAANALNNAVAELVNLAELAPEDPDGEDVLAFVSIIKRFAEEVTPKRPVGVAA